MFRAIWSLVWVLPEIISSFLPYSIVLLAFGAFIVWNGGIVLGTCAIILRLRQMSGGLMIIVRGQVKSHPSSPHSAVVLLCCVCDLFRVASASGRNPGRSEVDPRCVEAHAW